ncbi:hypothetical protein CL655_00255 [bacterium]|nr:hypothetical protein [bacterium]|tara:strand:- start:6258 stop:6965 length:708 start_codon:yes stop_codon:yes gene_type:complete
MDTRDLIKATQSTQRLIQDENYYKYIFKKTERVVSVVFYITQSVQEKDRYERQITDIEDSARALHDVVLQSLNVRAHVAEESVQDVTHALITLESKLRVAQAMGVIAGEVLQVIDNEIDSVLRALARYSHEDQLLAERSPTPIAPPKPARRQAPVSPQATTQPTGVAASNTPDASNRRARILTIIEAKGEVSIKDITDIISDVSEKTIQRELNAMIENNQIKRIGERRWSKYTLF